MSSFHLQIVTPDGLYYEGEAEKLTVRAADGNVTILPKHINYVVPLGMGEARVSIDGSVRKAACIGGMLAVKDGAVKLIATTFEWQEEIDLDRAKRAMEKAKSRMESTGISKDDFLLAQAKLRRALVRIGVAKQ